MIDQVKAVQATISKKAGEETFSEEAPDSNQGIQPNIWEGRSPKLPLQGLAVQPERTIPKQPKETTELEIYLQKSKRCCKNAQTNQLMQVGIVPTAADNLLAKESLPKKW